MTADVSLANVYSFLEFLVFNDSLFKLTNVVELFTIAFCNESFKRLAFVHLNAKRPSPVGHFRPPLY
jgi:hypothetical protein